MVEIRGVEPLTFSMPSCNGARTAEDRARQSRILADCLICSYSMNPTSRTVCTMFVLNPHRTHGREIVSHPAAVERGPDFIVENVGKPRNIKGCRLRAFPIRREPDNQPL